MRRLLEDTAQRAIRYLEGLSSRTVAPAEDAVARLRMFDEPLPDHPSTPESVVRLLDEIGSPATMATAFMAPALVPLTASKRKRPSCPYIFPFRGTITRENSETEWLME